MPKTKTPTSSTKLTRTQLNLLASAEKRKDRVLAKPDRTTDAMAARLAGPLLQLDLAREVAARGAMPVWRRDGTRDLALKLTPAGRAVLGDGEQDQTEAAAAPRADSKIARVIARLIGPDGASLSDLTAMTGWLPHTTRAALTGLRRRGFQIVRTRGANRAAIYRISASPEAASAAR